MPTLIIPNVFVNGTVADADPVNDNFNAVANVVNDIDNANIGPAGIYANQIKPQGAAQATFGGTAGYTFEAYDANTVALTVSGAPSQAVDFFRVVREDGTRLLWVASDFSVNTNAALNVGGDITTMGVVNATTFNITSNTITLAQVEATNLLLADNELRVHGNAFFTADVNVTDELLVPQIDLGLQGYLRFGMPYQFTQESTNLSMAAGAVRLPGTSSWQAQATAANIVQPTSTSVGTKFYADTGLTSGSNYTPTQVAAFDAIGLILQGAQQNGTRIRIPFGNLAIGAYPPGGLYLGCGFHYDTGDGGFVADATMAVGIFLGVRAGVNNRFEVFFQTGLTVGAVFTPDIVMTLGTGATNQIVCNDGIAPKNADVIGTTGPTIYGGTGVPPAALGQNGDYYFNNGPTGNNIYRNISGTWVIVT